MKRAERIAISLRTQAGISTMELQQFARETDEFIMLGLLRESNGKFLLTQKGKSLADSVAAAFL
jgi:coproporphyrinogen III oxidase-like Fe-S oxidoreductase